MQLHTVVPAAIRRRYGAKVAGWCLLVGLAVGAAHAGVAYWLLAGADGDAVTTDALLTGIAGIGSATAAGLLLLAVVLGRGTGRSLRSLADDAEAIAAGDYQRDVETARIDDLGRAHDAIAELRDGTEARIEELEAERQHVEAARRSLEVDNDELLAEAERFSEVLDACADGDLTRRLDAQTDHEAMAKVAGSVNRMLSELERAVVQVARFAEVVDDASSELQASAQEIGEASDAVSKSVREISEGSSRQTDDLQAAAGQVRELSATIEEVAATTSTIAKEAERVSGLADDGVSTATTAADQMHEAEDHTARVANTIARLNEDAERIAESITLIDDIAQQTNMLALNAAIETARTDQDRTGDNGGFDVVADEVQELSAEIQEAVDEIQETIASLQARATETADEIGAVEHRITAAVDSVDDLEAELVTVSDRVENVSDSVHEIDHVSNDQASTVEALAGLVENVAMVSAETSREADRVADASADVAVEIGEVSAKARSLDSQADRLTDVVGQFDVSTRQQLQSSGEAVPAPSASQDGDD
ncbi:methyl-accepting chemotaxis protein [Salinarchaeum sp. Harcht-Bsk1]|uniref:methyl-accepting chemotaxis protein n=1 Tax=Salinarchaeum sp. Harcht-Bsk1 TaxID=1333523 RepID=UPI0003424059|nr:methyl-accepting chemotaxis protein [Salinarchaeum sp. Harcht-Bsk1]AGN02057.1 methyl-accepting chemotaxis protein [Salinarchaeum sp. Harcht-Bsk1]